MYALRKYVHVSSALQAWKNKLRGGMCVSAGMYIMVHSYLSLLACFCTD